jgi:hypothetical protein
MSNCNQISSSYNLARLDQATLGESCTVEACKFSALPSMCVGVRDSAGMCQRASMTPHYTFAASGAGGGTAKAPITMSPNSLLSGSEQPPNTFAFESTGPRYSATKGGCEVIGIGSAVSQMAAGFVPLHSGMKPITSYGLDQNYINLASQDYSMGIQSQFGDGWGQCSSSLKLQPRY